MPVYVKPTKYLRKVDGYIEVKRKGYIMEPAKVLRCRICGKIILKKKKGVKYTKEVVLSAIRRHYKEKHPKKFIRIIEKAVRTRKERAKRKNPGNPRKKGEIPVLKILEF